MEVQRGPVPEPPERRRIPRAVAVAVAGRVLLGLAGLVLGGWGMAGVLDGAIHVGHIAAGVGGVALIILALAGPARAVQVVVQGMLEGGAGSR